MASITLAPKAINWADDPIWVEFSTSLISGGEASEPNLSLYVRIDKNGAFHAELNVPFHLGTGKVDMDLSGLSLVYSECPTDSSISGGGSGSLDDVAAEIILKYNEQYGTPAVKPSTLTWSDPFMVIYGHTPYGYGVGAATGNVLLHSYYTPKGLSAIKEVRKSQPEYVYIYSHSGGSVTVGIEIIYTDDTSDTDTGPSISLTAKKVTWVAVGWDALGMDSKVNPSKTVNSYVLTFDLGGGNTQVIIYALDDHDTEYDEYILYDNGIGGCEVLRCSGRHRYGVEVQRDTITYARNRGRTYRDGYTLPYNQRGNEVMQLNTGHQDQNYIRHIGQLLLSTRVWYINTHRGSFDAVTVKDTSVTTYDADNDVHNMGFTIVFDDKPAIGTFGI